MAAAFSLSPSLVLDLAGGNPYDHDGALFDVGGTLFAYWSLPLYDLVIARR